MRSKAQKYHTTLANHFAEQPLFFDGEKQKTPHVRKCMEQPWHYLMLNDWEHLHNFIADLQTFGVLGNFNWLDIRIYWTEIERNSIFRAPDTYDQLLRNPSSYPDYSWPVAQLLSDLGYSQYSKNIWLYLANYYSQHNNSFNQNRASMNACECHISIGEMSEAEQLLQSLLTRLKQNEDLYLYAAVLHSLARIYSERRELKKALENYNNAEIIAGILNDSNLLADCFSGKARILFWRGKYAEATELFKKEERLVAGQSNPDKLVNCYLAQAEILRIDGKLNDALEIIHKAEIQSHKIGNKTLEAKAIGAKAMILEILGQSDEALKMLQFQKYLYENIQDLSGIAKNLGNQAKILIVFILNGEVQIVEEAMNLLVEQEKIARSISDMTSLIANLQNQAIILRLCKAYDQAYAKLDQKESLCRANNDLAALASCLQEKANILLYSDERETELNHAKILLEEKIKICNALGLKRELATGLGSLGNINSKQCDFAVAITHLQQAVAIQRELKDMLGLARSLYSIGLIYLKDQINSRMADPYLLESLAISREYNIVELLQRFQDLKY